MTLNDILAGLPGTIVNRFSASNSAFWIAKCSDILSDLDTLCPGPWMIDEVHALPMASGFIKKPLCMSRIKDVRIQLDDKHFIGSKECVKSFNDLGVELNKCATPEVISSSQDVYVSATDDESVLISAGDEYATFSGATREQESLEERKVSITTSSPVTDGFYNGAAKITRTGSIGSVKTTVISSTYLGQESDTAQLWRIVENPGYLANISYATFTITPVMQLMSGNLSISSNEDYSDIIVPNLSHTPLALPRFKPGRIFARKQGTLFSSNVLVLGYMKTPKPMTLSDELMLPSEWDHLIQAGLRWKAEVDISPASSDAIVCGKMYNNAVKEYRSKMTMGQGRIHPSTFQGATIHTGDIW